ncbi:unnamed protein product [Zymoseptoria tritici ST99CH_3D1]|nr:unnamed protein product [Zymoseptoria tritici ST99CH_3D1]
MTAIKSVYSAYVVLQDVSGFGVKSDRTITASDRVWDDYLKADSHKHAAKLRHRLCPWVKQCAVIFNKKIATGKHARTKRDRNSRMVTYDDDDEPAAAAALTTPAAAAAPTTPAAATTATTATSAESQALADDDDDDPFDVDKNGLVRKKRKSTKQLLTPAPPPLFRAQRSTGAKVLSDALKDAFASLVPVDWPCRAMDLIDKERLPMTQRMYLNIGQGFDINPTSARYFCNSSLFSQLTHIIDIGDNMELDVDALCEMREGLKGN